jgi:c(7)-type cytochrome triheme protein
VSRARELATAAFVLFATGGVLSPSTSTSVPDRVRIPVVKPHPGGIPAQAALFRHSAHGQYGCYACHPSLFPRERIGFTHADMDGGRLCATCHDGGSAFAIAGADCGWCHAPK